jgi:putative tricarboxylic transport membrane protein
MPLDHDQATPGPRPWWLGGAVVAVGALWLYGAVQLPIVATHARIGPGMFVAIVGGALVLLGLALTVQIARGTRFEPQDAEDAVAGQAPSRKALLTALLGAALPLYTMERFGFVVSAALVFALTARAFGARKPVLGLAIGAALGAATWFGFSALGVQLGTAWRLPSLAALLPHL